MSAPTAHATEKPSEITARRRRVRVSPELSLFARNRDISDNSVKAQRYLEQLVEHVVSSYLVGPQLMEDDGVAKAVQNERSKLQGQELDTDLHAAARQRRDAPLKQVSWRYADRPSRQEESHGQHGRVEETPDGSKLEQAGLCTHCRQAQHEREEHPASNGLQHCLQSVGPHALEHASSQQERQEHEQWAIQHESGELNVWHQA